MAAAHKRITRKDLRQPDWFQVTTEKAFEIYEGHRTPVLIGVSAAIVMLLAIWGWQVFKGHQNAKAGEEFAAAAALYHAENYREAVAAFEKVADYRWSHYATFARLYLAHSYIAMNNLNKAMSEAQRFVSATSPDSLYRQIGLLTLAHAEESKGQMKEALQHYTEAERLPGTFRETALLGRARIAERSGDLKSAIAAYREYTKESPGSPFALKIAELEAQTAVQPAAK